MEEEQTRKDLRLIARRPFFRGQTLPLKPPALPTRSRICPSREPQDRRDRAAERTVELTPQFLLMINWADSGPGSRLAVSGVIQKLTLMATDSAKVALTDQKTVWKSVHNKFHHFVFHVSTICVVSIGKVVFYDLVGRVIEQLVVIIVTLTQLIDRHS